MMPKIITLKYRTMIVKEVWGKKLRKSGLLFLLTLTVLGVTACYYPGPNRIVVRQQSINTATSTTIPVAPVYFYPTTGQTSEQQDRDRYECYYWAVDQTNFDPSLAPLPPAQRITVVPVPAPGQNAAVLGVGGALLGALVGGPRHALGGALIGGAVGAITGAASDAARHESARQEEEAYNSRYDQARESRFSGKAQEFRRAMSACLEGRGYSVQ
jgi:hypothetical protein